MTGHACDVADEAQVGRFRDEVLAAHDREHVNLLFNNAGVGGGYSFIAEDRAGWDRTFAICWGGVYNCSRAFVPLIVASDAGYIVNTSSVNGFWAALGPNVPHSAYSTAKFAVKGFSESLITDLRVNAPHVKVAVVMPGHIGTGIVANSMRILANDDAASIRRSAASVRRRIPCEGTRLGERGGNHHPRRGAQRRLAHPRRRRRRRARRSHPLRPVGRVRS